MQELIDLVEMVPYPRTIVAVIVGLALLGLAVSANDRKDVVFVRAADGCKGDTVQCARQLWFNGDWKGTELCRAHTCVVFEEIFDEKRH